MNAFLFDSHAHYFDPRFDAEYPGGADALLSAEVFSRGVGTVINVATNPKNARLAIAMASRYSGMYAAVGIHPEDAQFLDRAPEEELAELGEILGKTKEERSARKIVALGEIGLDYHTGKDGSFLPDVGIQKAYFDAQMKLAEKWSLPVIIHDREAHGDCFETVLRYPGVTGVFHSYSGSREMALELLRRGWYLSFSGVATFQNAARVREVIAAVPLERMLIETDAPYLAPHPFRGKLNHSGLLHYTAEAIAAVKGIPVVEVAERTAKNASELFGIPLSPCEVPDGNR